MQSDMKATLNLLVNGQELSVQAHNLEALLLHLGIDSRAVVAEVNAAIVTPENFSSTELADGDRIELVRFVGGG